MVRDGDRSVRVSEFRDAVERVFGSARGAVLCHDLVIGELGERTADQALAEGEDVRAVWEALCRAQEVPEAERAAGHQPPAGRRTR
ncbi:MAG: DUF3046 domain-containing protein [Microbacterium sp.]|nr:DUF3046 domain-containing protein [Microbacterium sp.]